MVHIRIEDLETYALVHNIPIMLPDGIAFLTNYIKEHKIKKILEIGSAIGYSAIKMALLGKEVHVTTIERDPIRYQLAVENIKAFELEGQIEILLKDALVVELTDQYDLIFIDAAKSQYIKFFEKFKKNLTQDGVIVSDNLDFHGLTKTTERIASRNVRQLVRKINSYITFLKENEEFETRFYSLGDGVGVSKRRY